MKPGVFLCGLRSCLLEDENKRRAGRHGFCATPKPSSFVPGSLRPHIWGGGRPSHGEDAQEACVPHQAGVKGPVGVDPVATACAVAGAAAAMLSKATMYEHSQTYGHLQPEKPKKYVGDNSGKSPSAVGVQSMKATFEALDEDHDGVLDIYELEDAFEDDDEFHARTRDVKQLLARLDRDGEYQYLYTIL